MIFQKLDFVTNPKIFTQRQLSPVPQPIPNISKRRTKKIFQKSNKKDYSFIDQCKRTFSAQPKNKIITSIPQITLENFKPLEFSPSKYRYVRAYTPIEKVGESSVICPKINISLFSPAPKAFKTVQRHLNLHDKPSKPLKISPNIFKIDTIEGW